MLTNLPDTKYMETEVLAVEYAQKIVSDDSGFGAADLFVYTEGRPPNWTDQIPVMKRNMVMLNYTHTKGYFSGV